MVWAERTPLIEIKAPQSYAAHRNSTTVFLAGSIEAGAAANWHEAVCEHLRSKDLVVLNPRRDDWDSSWKMKSAG